MTRLPALKTQSSKNRNPDFRGIICSEDEPFLYLKLAVVLNLSGLGLALVSAPFGEDAAKPIFENVQEMAGEIAVAHGLDTSY
jgi:hypothetical protein